MYYLDFGHLSDTPLVKHFSNNKAYSVILVSAYLTDLVFSILRNMDCFEIKAVTLNKIRLKNKYC